MALMRKFRSSILLRDKTFDALNARYLQYDRKLVSMQGLQTNELIEEGKIITPYPQSIARIELNPRDQKFLAVLVPKIEDIDESNLSRPTPEDAVRFASQLKPKDVNVDKTIVFPSNPPYSGDVLVLGSAPSPWWLTLAWRPEKGISELCLYSSTQREEKWPQNTFFVGIAKL